MIKQTRKKLGDLLVEVGMLTKEQLDKALDIQKQTGEKIGEILLSEGFVTQNDIIQVLEFQLGIPHVNLEKYEIDQPTCLLIPENLARRYGLIPIRQENGILTVAMSDPLNVFAIDDVKIYSGLEVQPVISTLKDINKAIDRYYSAQKAMQAVEEFKKEQGSSFKIHSEHVDDQSEEEINNSPAVKLVNTIIEQAVRSRASDIHIEPFERFIKIRYRTDGQLREAMRPEIEILPAIAARIKIIGGMNIAEKRLPQDGRIGVQIDGKDLDLRVSILPTVYGEKIVIRIADKAAFLISKDKLGFNEVEKQKFEKMLMNPHGIILVTGPTGSGKTTTLYSAVNAINKPNINIITIEDPVECLIEGVNQVQVNHKAGMTFASGLRSILRQDPDVIMLGEIRDGETAEIAVRAAITGHLVLSTLHTNDAPGSVIRLVDMGIEPFLVSSSMVGVIAQRLIKKICINCKIEYEPTAEELNLLGLPEQRDLKLHRGRGCPVCNSTGYAGRVGIYEVMQVNKKLRALINKGCTEDELRDAAIEDGMITLRDNARKLVLDGITTLEEAVKITYSND
ncbi:MAG: ATPase, T2SS/T4P/T4SS family [Clostridia bacterium]|nr:ATPase, T2SS/T4P/T4SS family [Clostridia bacterium]